MLYFWVVIFMCSLYFILYIVIIAHYFSMLFWYFIFICYLKLLFILFTSVICACCCPMKKTCKIFKKKKQLFSINGVSMYFIVLFSHIISMCYSYMLFMNTLHDIYTQNIVLYITTVNFFYAIFTQKHFSYFIKKLPLILMNVRYNIFACNFLLEIFFYDL